MNKKLKIQLTKLGRLYAPLMIIFTLISSAVGFMFGGLEGFTNGFVIGMGLTLLPILAVALGLAIALPFIMVYEELKKN